MERKIRTVVKLLKNKTKLGSMYAGRIKTMPWTRSDSLLLMLKNTEFQRLCQKVTTACVTESATEKKL